MHLLRALIRDNRRLALALLVLAFCMRAFVPAGFMVASSQERVLDVRICSDASGGLRHMQIVLPVKERDASEADPAKKGEHCTFSTLAKVAIGGADAALLAIALAFILVLGLVQVRRLPYRAFAHLRPPLRGPPATA